MIDSRTGFYFTPCSVKAVVVRGADVLLCMNHRGEWELPGGWPSREDGSLEETLRREVLEEAGLDVRIDGLLSADLLATPQEGSVALVIYRAFPRSEAAPIPSVEHREVEYVPLDNLPSPIPDAYRGAIELARVASR